jgi:cellulose synthase/poly-beta-1,6-N-acetylglucosamine synthase-like glycosyltransferase
MLTYRGTWEELREFTTLNEPSTFISVIIPARNEAINLPAILADLSAQNYPNHLLEVIVIDDHSEDDTFDIAKNFSPSFSFYAYKLDDSDPKSAYKKRTIEFGVQHAHGKLIVTTDADCRLQKNWLRSIASFYESENYRLIAAPVCFQNDQTLFEKFQALDFCGMQLITGASLQMQLYNMANGANLAYERQAFIEVGGYSGIDEKASGDDMLLVYKIAKKFEGNVGFLKNKGAVVYTNPCKTLNEFLQQRFRWTSKSGSYQDKKITCILGLVYLFVVSIWINFFAIFIQVILSGHVSPNTICVFIFQLLIKSAVDYLLLNSAATFFNRKDLMKTF